MGEAKQGQLAQILQSGVMHLQDVTPEQIAGYLEALRQMPPDRRIHAAVKHTRMTLGAACAALPQAAEGVPTSEALRMMARARYQGLPPALEQVEPDYLPPIEECDLAKIASTVGRSLEACGARWCLAGGLGCCAFGEPRPLDELEFLVELEETMVPALVKHLGESIWSSPAALSGAAARHERVAVFQVPFLVRVWLTDARASELDALALARRVRIEGSSCGRMWICAAEDSVLRALLAWRDAEEGEEVYWRDLAMILAVQGAALDAGHLDAHARRLELFDILKEARAQVGLE